MLIVTLEPTKTGANLPPCVPPVLCASALVPVLRALLRQSLDISEQFPQLFKALVRTVRVLTAQPELASVLGHIPGDDDSKSLAQVVAEHASALLHEDDTMDGVLAAAVKDKLRTTVERAVTVASSEAKCARADVVASAAPPAGEPEAEATEAIACSKPIAASSAMAAEEAYAAALKPLQFASLNMETAPAAAGGPAKLNHKYASYLTSESTAGSQRAVKLMRELRALRSALPLNTGSSVFLRHDKKRPHVMQVMISGPQDTPYDSGLYLFDVYCPPGYPNEPPKVNLMTTGGGSVRFSEQTVMLTRSR